MKSKVLHFFLTILIIVILWWVIAGILKTPVLPQPGKIFSAFLENSDSIRVHLLASTLRIITGVGIALLSGVPLGLILGRIAGLDKVFAPLIYLCYPIPKIAFLPVVLLVFGLGDTSKIFLISIIVFFQVVVTSRDAAKSIDPELILSVRSLGASRWQLFWHVVFPASLPGIFTAIRISTGTAIAVLFFTETFATFMGLGYFIMDAWTRVNYPEMFAGIFSLSLLGLLLFLLIDFLERIFCKWLFLDKE